MTPDLISLVQSLSKSDTKTLSQKTLKTTEEVGELAKSVLPYGNAFATTHRFTDASAILDNVADVMLCVMSIGFDLGYDMQDIEDVMRRKAVKWADLQRRETKAQWPVPFEVHISVKNADIPSFRSVCASLGVKPLLLDLQNNGASVLHDVMTSHVHLGDNQSVYKELQRVSNGLRQAGFDVVREKVEAAPWHPMAPSDDHVNPTMPPNCYFESHFSINIPRNDMESLMAVCSGNNLHLSRNIFKSNEDGTVTVMATYRVYDGTTEKFIREKDLRVKALENAGFRVDKTVVEFALYDTKISHDAAWLKNGSNDGKSNVG